MKILKQIKNYLKFNDKYLKSEKEAILAGFSDCDKNISKIYFGSVSNEESSFYKLNLLQKRLFNVLDNLDELSKIIYSHNDKCNVKRKLMINLSIACLGLGITSGIIFFGNPIHLLFLGGLLYFVKKANDYKRCGFSTKEAEDIYNQAIYNSNTMMNSIKYIEKKKQNLTNTYESKVEQNPYIFINYYANKIIGNYLDNGVIERIPYYIEEEIVSILQGELNTSESNLYTLLNMAREEVKSSGLNETISRTREKKESN